MKNIVILGANEGIGYWMAKQLLEDGNLVGVLDICTDQLDYLKQQYKEQLFVMKCNANSPYASSKGAIEALAKCMNIEYKKYNISFHIFHPPLTNTNSSSPLPVPKEFMASPEKVGVGLARHIGKKSFIICHSLSQKMQTMICYLFPVKMGKLMSKMTEAYEEQK